MYIYNYIFTYIQEPARRQFDSGLIVAELKEQNKNDENDSDNDVIPEMEKDILSQKKNTNNDKDDKV